MTTQEIKLDFDDTCLGWVTGPSFTAEEIIEKRRFIMESMNLKVREKITLDNFNKVLDARTLLYLFALYDFIFFDKQITNILDKNGCIFQICFDNMCTKTAGFCSYKNKCKRMVIKLSTKVFQESLKSDKIRLNAGIPCKGLLNCLLVTFEHELTHALIGCFCFKYGHSSVIQELKPESKRHLFDGPFNSKNGHSEVFMTIVNKKYGHTKYTHDLFKHIDLPDNYEYLVNDTSIDNIKKSLKKGMMVKFYSGKDDNVVTVQVERVNLTKFKAIQSINKMTRVWNIPYGLLIKQKLQPSTVKKPSDNTKPIIHLVNKPQSIKKPNNIPKKSIIFRIKRKLGLNNKTVKWSGPHKNKYLMGIPKEYKTKYGSDKITDMEVAKERSIDLGSKSSGITKGKKYYSVRAGKVLIDSSAGEISWLKP